MASDTEADSAAFMENDIGIYAQLKEGCPYGGGGFIENPCFSKKIWFGFQYENETKAKKPR